MITPLAPATVAVLDKPRGHNLGHTITLETGGWPKVAAPVQIKYADGSEIEVTHLRRILSHQAKLSAGDVGCFGHA